jgi:hypothetical protein
MKRLALLSVIVMMLAATVLAPVAMAQAAGEVDVQEVRLGPQGSVIVSGTIQCTEGRYYFVSVTVRQRSQGNTYNLANEQASGQCATTGPTAFTITMFGERPFHRGPAAVSWFAGVSDEPFVCDPNAGCDISQGTEDAFIR